MNTFDDSFKDLPEVQLSPEVQRQHLAYLQALPDSADLTHLGAPPSRRRRRHIVSGISAAVILAGAGTAAAFGAFTTVTNTDTAYCYRTANLDERSGNRMEFATQGTKQNPRDAAASGVDI